MLDVAPTPLITAPPPIAGAIFLDASLAACDAQRGHAAPIHQQPHQGEGEEQRAGRQRDRADRVSQRRAQLAAFVQQRSFQRERREGGEPAEDASCQKESELYRQARLESRVFGNEAHQK